MLYGISSGILWALDTILIGIALNANPYFSMSVVIVLTPFISTFLHDFVSAVLSGIYLVVKGKMNIKETNKEAIVVVALAAILGGPIGMTSYIYAINNIGPGLASIISSVYPAVCVILSVVFLKEKIRKHQILGLLVCLIGVILVSYSSEKIEYDNKSLGIIAASITCIAWASEAVIISHALRNIKLNDDFALFIRQTSSSFFYGIILLPILKAWPLTIQAITNEKITFLIVASFFGTLSYLFYYRAINKIGAARTLPLNISYTAWTIVFSAILLNEKLQISQLVLVLAIIGGSILASIEDIGEIKKKD